MNFLQRSAGESVYSSESLALFGAELAGVRFESKLRRRAKGPSCVAVSCDALIPRQSGRGPKISLAEMLDCL